MNFVAQRAGPCEICAESFKPLERATITSNTYRDWMFDDRLPAGAAQQVVGQFRTTFKDYPPRQKAASFTVD
jgi:hypothetical protein